jgi:hypothetical protein
MAKPTSLPRWSETVAGVPGTNEVEPTEGKKDTGYGTGGDIPTSGGLNWWMRLVYLWAKWLDSAASIATASALVVRDAAGRARFADPSDVADADTKGARDAAITTALTTALAVSTGALTMGSDWSQGAGTVLKKTAGIVTLTLYAVSGSTATPGVVATLPVGYRPNVDIQCIGQGKLSAAMFNVKTTGVIEFFSYQTSFGGFTGAPSPVGNLTGVLISIAFHVA